MGNEHQPYVVCIGKTELVQYLRFEPDKKNIIQTSSEWKWESYAGFLACLLRNLGCRTKLITKAYSDMTGQFLKQLLEQSGFDAHLVFEEPSFMRAYQRFSEHIHTRVIEKNMPATSPVAYYAVGPNLRLDEISMTDLQDADLVVIASQIESKPKTSSEGLNALVCRIKPITEYEWRRLNDTLNAASQIGQQGIPVLCMFDRPFWGANDDLLGNRVEELFPHLQHIKFLALNGFFMGRRDAFLQALLQKLNSELPYVFFPEVIEDQTQPAPLATEGGSSCCLRRPQKRSICCHTSGQESSALLDSKLKANEQDLLFLGGFIASHLKGNSVKGSMEEGALLAQDAKMLAALINS